MGVKRFSTNSIKNQSATIAVSGTNSTTTSTASLITATGGTETTAGPYKIHTFGVGPGTFTITSGTSQNIEYLMLAGAGPAGFSNGNVSGGAPGGLLMWWPGSTSGGQCIGPRITASSGDVFAISVGAGGTCKADNSTNNCGNDTTVVKNNIDTYLLLGGGGGGGGSLSFVGYNGGSGAGSPGTGNQGVNPWPAGGSLTGELQYQYNYGRSFSMYKQGNGNSVKGVAIKTALGSPGAHTASSAYLTITADTVRNGFPGYGPRTSWSGTLTEYAHGGMSIYPTTGLPPTPSIPGSGGHGRNGTGASGNGSAGIVQFKYLTNTTVKVAGVELLMVGGGGGSNFIGGGGGGSVIYYGNDAGRNGTPLTLYEGTYTIIVGAGGNRTGASTVAPLGTTTSVYGIPTQFITNNNLFGGYDALGGGGAKLALGEYWGSGSGGFNQPYWNGLANPVHGYNGGQTPTSCGGGGGGAGGAGADGVSTTACGNGGIGKAFTISGLSTYYGGGGGGGKGATGGTQGLGGAGGGGNGLSAASGTIPSGTTNTGGGGGGGPGSTGGNGGSGIVIMRYPDSYPAASATTGSPTITTSGGWRTYRFTSSGSITF